jgi:hypothetical protein
MSVDVAKPIGKVAEPGPASRVAELALRKGIVAYLDVLGTKDLRGESAMLERAKALRDLAAFGRNEVQGPLASVVNFFTSLLTGRPGLAEQQLQPFSDSMMISIPITGDGVLELSTLSDLLLKVFHYGMARGLPLRGAVSVGRFIATADNIFVGEAVNEAVEWEKVAEWSGVVLAPSASSIVKIMRKRKDPGAGLFVDCDVPVKPGYQGLARDSTVLNWPVYGPPDLAEQVETRYLSEPMPADAAQKMLNTVRFIRTVKKAAEDGTIPPPSKATNLLVLTVWELGDAARAGIIDDVPP